jgi:hypothetical protein
MSRPALGLEEAHVVVHDRHGKAEVMDAVAVLLKIVAPWTGCSGR